MASSSAVVVAVVGVVLLGMGWPATVAVATTACKDCPTPANCSSTCSHNVHSQEASDNWLACTGPGPCGPPPDPVCVQSCKSKAPGRCADARCKRECAACSATPQQCGETIKWFIEICAADCNTRCKRDCVDA